MKNTSCGCSSSQTSSCCGQTGRDARQKTNSDAWTIREKTTAVGSIPLVSTELSAADLVNGWKARWGLNRMNYAVRPGLYGVGDPDEHSPVLVTANYKLTFDKLRKELSGLDTWLLVLDTKGVNVWCAAGKGTFGTAELLRQIAAVNLAQVVTHRTLILPQLGATGIAAHDVLKTAGFKVVYGPVRARDIRLFIQNGLQKSDAMRQVEFPLSERLAVVPIELVGAVKPLLLMLALFVLVNLWKQPQMGLTAILAHFLPYVGAVLVGSVVFAMLLPYLPTRSFALNGALLGGAWSVLMSLWYQDALPGGITQALILAALSAYISLNFTGSSTFTSLSGAQLEVKVATPLIIGGLVVGVVSYIVV